MSFSKEAILKSHRGNRIPPGALFSPSPPSSSKTNNNNIKVWMSEINQMAKSARGAEMEKTIQKYKDISSFEEWLEKTPNELKGMIIMYNLMSS